MIIFQWDLVCSKQFYPTLALTIFGISGLFGMLLFGFIQDGLVNNFIFNALGIKYMLYNTFKRLFAFLFLFLPFLRKDVLNL